MHYTIKYTYPKKCTPARWKKDKDQKLATLRKICKPNYQRARRLSFSIQSEIKFRPQYFMPLNIKHKSLIFFINLI